MEVMLQIWRLFNYIIYQGCRKWRRGSVKFIHSEKATKFCEIFTLLLTGTTLDKSKVKISQNCVAFSEYMNFTFVEMLGTIHNFEYK